jgi:hypothetical protein
MNIKKVTILLVLLLLIIITNSYPKTKQDYSLKLINKFQVPELPKIKNHLMGNFNACMAVSDSLIYFADVNDSTSTKSYCYDFQGEKQTDFSLPTNTEYQSPLTYENCFFYLPSSHQLAYININKDKKGIDFYNLEGKYLLKKPAAIDSSESFLDVAEFNGKKYYIACAQLKPQTMTYSIKLYEGQVDGELKVIHYVAPSERNFELGISFRILQIDNYNQNLMAVSEVQSNNYRITVFSPDSVFTFNIPRENMYTIKIPNKLDIPYQFRLGANFVVLGSLSNKLKFPFKQEMYDLSGKYLRILKFDDNKDELVDIAGDKLVAVNTQKGTISIYEIKVK